MVGVDTNVLVRLLVSDDLAEQRAAAARLRALADSGELVFVPCVVIAELGWVLAAVYSYPRERIAAAVDAILAADSLVVESREAVIDAVAAFRRGPADLADYLIVSLAADHGATRVLTFDRKLARDPRCEMV